MSKKGKKNRVRFIPLLCPPLEKGGHYWSALLIHLAAADTSETQTLLSVAAAGGLAGDTALPNISLSHLFSRSAAQRALRHEAVGAMEGSKAPSR